MLDWGSIGVQAAISGLVELVRAASTGSTQAHLLDKALSLCEGLLKRKNIEDQLLEVCLVESTAAKDLNWGLGIVIVSESVVICALLCCGCCGRRERYVPQSHTSVTVEARSEASASRGAVTPKLLKNGA